MTVMFKIDVQFVVCVFLVILTLTADKCTKCFVTQIERRAGSTLRLAIEKLHIKGHQDISEKLSIGPS